MEHLGKEGYGIWALIGSIIGYYGLTQLGVASAINRYVARYAAQKNYDALNETVSTALAMFTIISILLVIVSFIIAAPLSIYFNISPVDFTPFKYAIWGMGGAAAIGMLGQVFRSTFAAHEYFVQRNLVLILITLLRALIVIVTLNNDWGLFGIAFAYFMADLVGFIVYLILVKIYTPWVKPKFSLVKWKRLKTLLDFGIFTSIIAMANIIRVNMDSVVIARMINLESLAVYSIAAVICRYFSQLIDSGMGVLIPRMSGMHALDDMIKFRQLLVKTLWIASILTCSIGLILLIVGDSLILLWVGDEYIESGGILTILLIGYLVSFGQKPGQNALFAMNKHKFFAFILMGEAVINLVLSIFLATKLGVIGVAIGTVIPLIIVKIIIQPIYTSKVVGIRLFEYLIPIFTTIFSVLIVYYLYLVFQHFYFFSINGYFSLILVCFLILISYCVIIEICLIGVNKLFFNKLYSFSLLKMIKDFKN